MRFYCNKKNCTEYPDGSIVYFTPFPFANVAKVANCLCPDGKRRTVYAVSYADTFFSIPATVKVKGKNVSGFLTTYDNERGCGWEFRAYTYRKNANVFVEAASE